MENTKKCSLKVQSIDLVQNVFVFVCQNNFCYFYNIKTEEIFKRLKVPISCSLIRLSPDQSTLIGSQGCELQVVIMNKDLSSIEITSSNSLIADMEFLEQNSFRFVVGCYNGFVNIYDIVPSRLSKPEILITLPHPVTQLSVGKNLISISTEKEVYLFGLQNKYLLKIGSGKTKTFPGGVSSDELHSFYSIPNSGVWKVDNKTGKVLETYKFKSRKRSETGDFLKIKIENMGQKLICSDAYRIFCLNLTRPNCSFDIIVGEEKEEEVDDFVSNGQEIIFALTSSRRIKIVYLKKFRSINFKFSPNEGILYEFESKTSSKNLNKTIKNSEKLENFYNAFFINKSFEPDLLINFENWIQESGVKSEKLDKIIIALISEGFFLKRKFFDSNGFFNKKLQIDPYELHRVSDLLPDDFLCLESLPAGNDEAFSFFIKRLALKNLFVNGEIILKSLIHNYVLSDDTDSNVKFLLETIESKVIKPKDSSQTLIKFEILWIVIDLLSLSSHLALEIIKHFHEFITVKDILNIKSDSIFKLMVLELFVDYYRPEVFKIIKCSPELKKIFEKQCIAQKQIYCYSTCQLLLAMKNDLVEKIEFCASVSLLEDFERLIKQIRSKEYLKNALNNIYKVSKPKLISDLGLMEDVDDLTLILENFSLWTPYISWDEMGLQMIKSAGMDKTKSIISSLNSILPTKSFTSKFYLHIIKLSLDDVYEPNT